MAPTDLIVHPIGVIHTPYTEKYFAPCQPRAGEEGVIGTIELFPHCNYEQALEDLEGFERIWIISWFHKNEGWKPKVLPPRTKRREKKGVFATRSPHRPNPIGLSLCTLIDIQGLNIRVENPDLLDGTPILDLKPYIPYAEAFPGSRSGWLEEVAVQAEEKFLITITDLAIRQAEWLAEKFEIYLLDHAESVLAADPFPHPSRRTTKNDDGSFMLAIKSWRVHYTIQGNEALITHLGSGYAASVILAGTSNGKPLHDAAAQAAFYERWGNNDS